MSDRLNQETAIKTILFSGKKSDFVYWKGKPVARSHKSKYGGILTGDIKIPTKVEYQDALKKSPQDDSSKDIVKRYELGISAYDDLILSMDDSKKSGKVAYSIIANATTTDNPDGDAALAWKRLIPKYTPQTAPNFIALKLLKSTKRGGTK